jgi:hypothetical protein
MQTVPFIELYNPLRPQIKAIKNGLALPWDGTVFNVDYDKQSVPRAYEYREKMLDRYLEAVEGMHCLGLEPRLDVEKWNGRAWERGQEASAITAALTGGMLGAMGAKAETEAFMEQVGGYVCVVENWLENGDAMVTPTVLIMACLQLLDANKFTPKPAEFMKACRQAAEQRHSAVHKFSHLEYWTRKCDAVLLLFAPEKWTEPYYLEDYADTLKCMLAAHEDSARWDAKLNEDGNFCKLLACAREYFDPQTALPAQNS